jgi:hypothetical protein
MTARLAGCGGMKSGVLPRAGTTFSSVATARLVLTLLALLAQKKVQILTPQALRARHWC